MARKKKICKTTGGGIGFTGFLALLFIGLKLTGYIDWSWLWVLAPLWIPIAIMIVVVIIYLTLVFIKRYV
jgi:hypothetical protein